MVRDEAVKAKVKFIVWNGFQDVETWAVSEAKAINNVAWRLRMSGKFPVMSAFSAKRA